MRTVLAIMAMAFSTPAWAHPGAHAHYTVLELVAHYAAADHLAFLALCGLVGWGCYRLGRRVEARKRVVSTTETRLP